MGYRNAEPIKRHRRTMQETATRNRTYVQNGSTAHIAIPCFYIEVKPPVRASFHNVPLHDHIGWPDPIKLDQSCQFGDMAHWHVEAYDHGYDKGTVHHYLDTSRLIPIHFEDEGYEAVNVSFANKPEGLTATGSFDNGEDWVARIDFDVACPQAIDERTVVPYTAFATGTIRGKRCRDLIAVGDLIILPGPIM